MLSKAVQAETETGFTPQQPAPTVPNTPVSTDKVRTLEDDLGISESTAATPGASVPSGGMEDAVFDSIADYLESGLEKAVKQQPEAKTAQAATVQQPEATTTISGTSDPLLGQGIEISVEIYIEILEAVSSSIAAWWAMDESLDFSFDKKLKARYAKVTELYAKTQNVQVSPGFLFGAFTLVLLGQVAFRAHKTRSANLRAEQFRRSLVERNPKASKRTGQIALDFGGTENPEPKKIVHEKSGGYIVPESERLRKDWKIDNLGYYERDANGTYLKKEERRQKPSPELFSWMQEMYRVNLVYPTNKQTKAFLQSI